MNFIKYINKILLNGRGRIALSKNEPEKAMSYFLEFNKLYPNDYSNLIVLFEASYKTCNWDAYINVRKNCRKNIPGHNIIYWWLGTNYLFIDRPETADKFFNLGIQYIQNQNKDYSTDWISYFYAKKAITNLLSKNYSAAEKFAKIAIKNNKYNVDAHFTFINYLYLSEQGDQVSNYLETLNLLEEDLFIKKLWTANHHIYYEENFDLGLQLFDEIFRNIKDFRYEGAATAQSFYNKFWTIQSIFEDYMNALDKIGMINTKAEQLRFSIPKIIRNQADRDYLLMNLEFFLGDYEKVIKKSKKRLTKKLNQIERSRILTDLALSLWKKNQYGEALEIASTAMQINPFSSQLKVIYGKILLQVGELEKAKLIFEDLLVHNADVFWNFMEYLFDLGMVYYKMNDYENALLNFNRLKRLHPKNTDAEKIINKIISVNTF